MSRTRPEERKGKPVKAGKIVCEVLSLSKNIGGEMVVGNSASVKSDGVLSVALKEGMVISAADTIINTREDR